MKNWKHHFLREILTVLLVLALIPIDAVKAEDLGTVWTGEYHFTENAEFADRITIKGEATIIVDPEVEVVMQKGITVSEGNTLKITGGGTLIANPEDDCAGIGGNGDDWDCGTIVIEECKVLAYGGEYGAGIGGGDECGFGNITIKNAYVHAVGGDYAAGIGSGDKSEVGGTILITGDKTEVTAVGGKEGAGIGSGNETESEDRHIIIEGGKITAYCDGKYGAGIGGGDFSDGGHIIIRGGDITAYGSTGSAGIGGGDIGEHYVGHYGGVGDLKIYGGNIVAIGGEDGAGIGSGSNAEYNGTIEIHGGNITATGGENGAGIGGGRYAPAGTITINGGTVEARGGDSASGIGVGWNCLKEVRGLLTVNDGHVSAYGGSGSAGIGGSDSYAISYDSVKGIDVVINDGYVLAVGMGDGAGIGGGDHGDGTFTRITGGTVIALAGNGCSAREEDGGSAIGAGDGVTKKDSTIGSIELYDGAKVTAGDDIDKIEKIFGRDERIDACQWRNYARIEPCDHPDSYYMEDEGGHIFVCLHCYTSHGEILDHEWDEGKVTKEPTYTEKGIMTYTCPLCHATKTEEIPEKEFIAPATGDESILLWSLLLSGSIMSMMILRKKLHHSYSN